MRSKGKVPPYVAKILFFLSKSAKNISKKAAAIAVGRLDVKIITS